MPGRRRLDPEVRRDELLDVGAELFATNAYESVSMEEIASRAGVSRALVYRYFPAKRDLFAGIYQRASDQLLEVSELRSDVPIADQISAGLDAHFDYFVANARTVIEANRGALAGDPIIQGIINAELSTLRDRILDASGIEGHERLIAGTALRGWLEFVRIVCVEWLADGRLSRDEIRDMCLRTLSSAVGPHLGTSIE